MHGQAFRLVGVWSHCTVKSRLPLQLTVTPTPSRTCFQFNAVSHWLFICIFRSSHNFSTRIVKETMQQISQWWGLIKQMHNSCWNMSQFICRVILTHMCLLLLQVTVSMVLTVGFPTWQRMKGISCENRVGHSRKIWMVKSFEDFEMLWATYSWHTMNVYH